MCENEQKPELKPEPWKKRAPELEPEPCSWKEELGYQRVWQRSLLVVIQRMRRHFWAFSFVYQTI